jgi:hypothetical protein
MTDIKTGDKVKFVMNNYVSDLTLNKMYEVLDVTSRKQIKIINDHGNEIHLYYVFQGITWFEKVEDDVKEKLDFLDILKEY